MQVHAHGWARLTRTLQRMNIIRPCCYITQAELSLQLAWHDTQR